MFVTVIHSWTAVFSEYDTVCVYMHLLVRADSEVKRFYFFVMILTVHTFEHFIERMHFSKDKMS